MPTRRRQRPRPRPSGLAKKNCGLDSALVLPVRTAWPSCRAELARTERANAMRSAVVRVHVA